MSHTQDDGHVEHHDHGERYDSSDREAVRHFLREGLPLAQMAKRLGRTVAGLRSFIFRERRAGRL